MEAKIMLNEKDFNELKNNHHLGKVSEEVLASIFESFFDYSEGNKTKEQLVEDFLANDLSISRFATIYELDINPKITVQTALRVAQGDVLPKEVHHLVVNSQKYGLKDVNVYIDRLALEIMAKRGNQKANESVTKLETWEKNHAFEREDPKSKDNSKV